MILKIVEIFNFILLFYIFVGSLEWVFRMLLNLQSVVLLINWIVEITGARIPLCYIYSACHLYILPSALLSLGRHRSLPNLLVQRLHDLVEGRSAADGTWLGSVWWALLLV